MKGGSMEISSMKWLRRIGRSFGMKAGLIVCASLWATNGVPPAHSDVVTLLQTLNAQLAPVGKVSAPASVTLTPTGTVFSPYGGSLTLLYRVRSTPGGTGGNITVQATGDFSPPGGPTVPSGGLSYTCSAATLGTACAGSQVVSLSGQSNVATIPPSACTGGGGACSVADPNSVKLDFLLQNNPGYRTGSYSATVTFTISST
jgi:hypothetical protein